MMTLPDYLVKGIAYSGLSRITESVEWNTGMAIV